MSLGCPSVVRANDVHSKFRKEMHASWIGMKNSLGLKIIGALACRLHNTTVTGSNRRNSMEANDLNQSELVHFSNIVRF